MSSSYGRPKTDDHLLHVVLLLPLAMFAGLLLEYNHVALTYQMQASVSLSDLAHNC